MASGRSIADSDESAIRTLDAVRELGPKIRAAADEAEQGRRLPLHLVREMQRAGVFRMAMPARHARVAMGAEGAADQAPLHGLRYS